ncbi:ead/Ea22-like family protein [Enterobacter hormaechei]|nr:ead/Ea22-like family protein [Enterobacter hormaechei]
MSNIDKRALREAAEKHGDDDILALLDELEAAENRINRLEAIVAVAEQRNALMREWKRALKVPCDLVDDQVPVVIHGMVIRLERLKDTEAKLEAAEKRNAEMSESNRLLCADSMIKQDRIAELEARKVKIKLPESFYPDGDIDCPLVINEYQIIEAIVAADCKPIAVCPRCKCELDLSHKPDGAHFCHPDAAGKGE